MTEQSDEFARQLAKKMGLKNELSNDGDPSAAYTEISSQPVDEQRKAFEDFDRTQFEYDVQDYALMPDNTGRYFNLPVNRRFNYWKAMQDALAPNKPVEPALKRYAENAHELEKENPLERLRFFCSLAMHGQDWLDAEPFFDAVEANSKPAEGSVEPLFLKFPRQESKGEDDWTVSSSLLSEIVNHIDKISEWNPGMEGAEQVLLALEELYPPTSSGSVEPFGYIRNGELLRENGIEYLFTAQTKKDSVYTIPFYLSPPSTMAMYELGLRDAAKIAGTADTNFKGIREAHQRNSQTPFNADNFNIDRGVVSYSQSIEDLILALKPKSSALRDICLKVADAALRDYPSTPEALEIVVDSVLEKL